jgi:hypothetical protein
MQKGADENAIRSFSTELGSKLRGATIFSDVGDKATWVGADVNRHAKIARGPP